MCDVSELFPEEFGGGHSGGGGGRGQKTGQKERSSQLWKENASIAAGTGSNETLFICEYVFPSY